MGNLQAQSLAEMVLETLSLDTAIAVHLQSNHYPPISTEFIPVAKEAIELANAGDWGTMLTYPNGLERSVIHTIDGLHLQAFLDDDGAEW